MCLHSEYVSFQWTAISLAAGDPGNASPLVHSDVTVCINVYKGVNMRVCVCVCWTATTAPSPLPAGLPHERTFLYGGCGRWSDGLRDRGQRGSQPPASSLFQTGPEAIRVLGGLSCHSPPAVTSVCTSPSQRPRPKHLPLSRFRALLQSCCLYSTAHPNSYPRPQANLFFFSCQYRLPLSSLGTVHWADPAGAVATKQAMHSWHHVHVDGWDAGWGWSVRV